MPYYDHMGHMGFFGMHIFWWIFWIAIIFGALIFMRPSFNPPWPSKEESALEILQKRYARGEISSQEFEERKAYLTKKTGETVNISSKLK